ncbi:hypothetical protein HY522_08670 [bacterium]|nr:hypothetical protein [bacterium]
MKRNLAKAIAVAGILGVVFILNYFVRVDFSWRQQGAEARTEGGGPQTTIHFEQTRSDINMQEETYILYADLDQDGDLDIAYTTNSPIRFIENKTVERR